MQNNINLNDDEIFSEYELNKCLNELDTISLPPEVISQNNINLNDDEIFSEYELNKCLNELDTISLPPEVMMI